MCLQKTRRQFVDILESFPQQCQHVIDLIGRVYKNEEDALESKLTPEQRLIFHQQRSGPAREELHQWASEQIDQRLVEPNSVLGKAITYLQRHWEPLTLFLRQPGAPIDNNSCERALKKAILHRKNSMFYKTRIGASLGDLFMSIFYTCQLNKINPLHYMNTVCEHHAEVVDNPEPGTTSRLYRRSPESGPPPGCLVPHTIPQWRRDLR
ncbi:MAG: IS66 family transposase [Verrucomicrobiota bacterium]